MLQPQTGFWRNLRDLPGSLTLSGVSAGFIVVLVGYTGPLLILLQAAEAGNLTPEQTSSWVWAVAVGNGIMTMLLSVIFRQPITAPWSTAGAVLMVDALTRIPFEQAIGAYIVASILMILLGLSGLFGRVMAIVPRPVVMGMLGGILLRYGLGIFSSLAVPENTVLVLLMIAAFFLLKRAKFRAPTLGVLVLGVVIAGVLGQLHFEPISFGLTVPVFTTPVFEPSTFLTVSLPLVALALTAQFAPGQAVLRAANYEPPINKLLVLTGIANVILAPFGDHGLTLGALTAAIITSPEAQPDPTRRYSASFMSGAFWLLFGLFGATIVGLFGGLPAALIATVAGLALSDTIGNSLVAALGEPGEREAGLVAFLCAGASFTLLGIGAPFWALVFGLIVYGIMRRPKVVVAAG